MLFIDNKYTRTYYSIISNAQQQNRIKSNESYFENHHIIPDSLGGTLKADNMVLLTAREHFICHMLLPKMLTGQDKHKMIFGFNQMLRISENQHRHLPKSHQYEYARKELAISLRVLHTGRKHTEESKLLMSVKKKGIPKSDETKLNMSKSAYNRRDEIANRARELGTLKKLWNDDSFREARSAEVSQRQKVRLSDPKVLADQVNRINKMVTCEHCKKTMNLGNHNRWHGDNCKAKL